MTQVGALLDGGRCIISPLPSCRVCYGDTDWADDRERASLAAAAAKLCYGEVQLSVTFTKSGPHWMQPHGLSRV